MLVIAIIALLATLLSCARLQYYPGEIKLEPLQLSSLLSRRLKTYAFDILPDGSLANKRLHCELGSDGMTLDTEGNLYLTVAA